MKDKLSFEEHSVEYKFKLAFEEYKKEIQEQVLFDVLTAFYFADWTRACDYEKMTSQEVMLAAMSVCKKLEEKYNYSLDDEFSDITFGCGGTRDDD